MCAVAENERMSPPGFSDWRTISASAAMARPISGASTENAGIVLPQPQAMRSAMAPQKQALTPRM